MNVDHALVACCWDDDKSITVVGLDGLVHLSQAGEEHRSLLFKVK
jgi:hypothetical protein